MLSGPLMRTLSGFGRKGNEYPRTNLAPRDLTTEEVRPITQGLSALLDEGVRLGTFPNGSETPEELAKKGLVKTYPDVQLKK